MHNIIKIVVLSSAFALAISYSVGQNQRIQCARITHIFPILSNEAKLVSYDTSYIDYYVYNNIRTYKFSYLNYTSENGILKKIDKISHYFVRDMDSIYGREFDTAFHLYNARTNLNSAAYIHAFSNLYLKESFETLNTKLISLQQDKDSVVLHEIYEASEKTDSTYKITWHFLYSNVLNDLPIHLSSFMDSVKKTHLYEFTIINPYRKLQTKNLTVDAFINSYKLEKIDCPDEALIFEYIHAYLKGK